MQKPVIVARKAKADIQAAKDWNDKQAEGLGDRLGREIVGVLRTIGRYPEIGPEVRPRVRRVLLRSFRYGVFYVVDKNSIRVLALLHHAVSPRKWPKR